MTKSQQSTLRKFIDPLTDFGFKRIFGSEPNKDLLIDLLNGVFRGRKHIVDLVYNKNEYAGDTDEIGAVIFDLTCTASNGEQFIIEVQRSAQVNLKRRMLYYGSKLISDQAPKGKRKEWNYAISEVYVIVLMDGFGMPDGVGDGRCLHDICLCNRDTGKVFYDDLGFIYLELINFVKEESELETDLDGWLFVLKNMSRLDRIPLYLRKPIFEKLFNIAEYSKLTKEEKEMYDTGLKRKWDSKAILDHAVKEGAEQKSYTVVANLMQQLGLDDETAADVAEVSIDFVRKVRADLNKKKQ
ncbi:Rpn family recombination-promoting nuclease/putative transposase [Parapedobacter koreensis]|uniref:Rpn family recombination-promoting nuclease/putative transposase n=1 Tax=Parapedobacter koreensis TaxID=332977 RepID=A0A1H7HV97_9SPHI|nr:Rpn family recombination-promoting nuclease/putative transposase [Parapedobacter koreensis]SEK54044.1 conserved hypothetical protein (putative transposase or invertase) [Parapedobacter koreensis]